MYTQRSSVSSFPYFSLVTERAFRACRLSSKRYARLRVSRERWREREGGREGERERRRRPYATKGEENRGGCERIQKRATEERRGRGFINKLIEFYRVQRWLARGYELVYQRRCARSGRYLSGPHNG